MTSVPYSIGEAVDLVVSHPQHPSARSWAEQLQMHLDVLVAQGTLPETQQEIYRARLAAVLLIAHV